MKETSKAAFRRAEESGLLSRQKLKCFEWFCRFGPCTVNELIADVGPRYEEAYRVPTHINKTPSMLKRHEVIEVVDIRPCQITGNLSEVWDVTGKSPKVLKPKLSKQQIRAELGNIAERLKQLTKELT